MARPAMISRRLSSALRGGRSGPLQLLRPPYPAGTGHWPNDLGLGPVTCFGHWDLSACDTCRIHIESFRDVESSHEPRSHTLCPRWACPGSGLPPGWVPAQPGVGPSRRTGRKERWLPAAEITARLQPKPAGVSQRDLDPQLSALQSFWNHVISSL